MSLYAFEHSVAYQVIFILFFVFLAFLILLSIIAIYRARYIQKHQQKLNKVRYIVAWCLVIQFFTFLGYYIQNVPLFAVLWNIWIPSWSIGYVFLSYNITLIRLPSKSLKMDTTSKQLLIWKVIWALWFGCSLSNWIGSIFGWGLLGHSYPHIQAFGYLLWKVIAFIMLSLMVYILFDVEPIIKGAIQEFVETDIGNKYDTQYIVEIKKGHKRIKNLIVFELLLSFFLLINVVYETYVIICVYQGVLFANIYAESTIMQMIVYYPLWTAIHAVLLSYGWISRDSMLSKEVRELTDLQNSTCPSDSGNSVDSPSEKSTSV